MPYPAEGDSNGWANARQTRKNSTSQAQPSSSPKQTSSPTLATTNPFAALAQNEQAAATASESAANTTAAPVSKYVQFPDCAHAYITTKWNGTNVTFFKYRDNYGHEFVTAKPRPFPTLRDMHQFDCTLSLTRQALALTAKGKHRYCQA